MFGINVARAPYYGASVFQGRCRDRQGYSGGYAVYEANIPQP